VRAGNDGLRFVLELCALTALGYWGYGVSYALMVLAPVAAAVLWGAFVAPKARWHPGDPWRLLLELAVFGSGVAALAATGKGMLAVVFGAAVALHLALTFPLGQRSVA
jgi:Protein of unknown function (DUF2568)